jgi:DNA polymerase-3 subunit delta
MHPTEFSTLLEQGNKLGPAYFLRGPDRFLHEECRSAIIGAIPSEAREWCFTEIEFKPGRLQEDLENAYQMPMMGAHSFLYVADEDDFDHANEQDTEALDHFLRRPPSFATAFFAAYEPDRRRRFTQLLEKKAELVEVLPLGPREAVKWLTSYLRREKVEIDSGLAERIVSQFEGGGNSSAKGKGTGVNLLWLRTEIDKLLVARTDKRKIEERDLDLIVAFREEHEIGKLLSALADRKLPDALVLLQQLLSSKEPETLLLWCIGDLFRQALKTSSGLSSRYGPWSRSMSPYSTFDIAPRASHSYSREELARALRLVRNTDLAIKSSWKDSRLLLESLLWQIAVGTGENGLVGDIQGTLAPPAP